MFPSLDPNRSRLQEVLEDFVEYEGYATDRTEVAELAQRGFSEDRRTQQAEAQANRRSERRIAKMAVQTIVCPACLEPFTVIDGATGRPRKWHNDKCRMKILREADKIRSESPSSPWVGTRINEAHPNTSAYLPPEAVTAMAVAVAT